MSNTGVRKIFLYPHGGSANHGCEALVRSTIDLFSDSSFYLSSREPKQDYLYSLDSISVVVPEHSEQPIGLLDHLIAKFLYASHLDRYAFEKSYYRTALRTASTCDLALSIGGDNYCYGVPEYLYVFNRLLDEIGIPRFLWGCSIEPSSIDDKMKKDLEGYRYIFARESLTYSALKKKGIDSVSLIPDPAFVLKQSRVSLPPSFIANNTVGINVSPMVLSHEPTPGIIERNYRNLISFVLNETDMNIALIPHVVWEDNDDLKVLNRLHDYFKNSNRICLIQDMSCTALKYIISQCRFLITARTHASIAAYSSGIPTIVMGYSVKAEGIANDIFGTSPNYVLSSTSLNSNDELLNLFRILCRNEKEVKNTLHNVVSNYYLSLKVASDHIIDLV